MPRHLLKFLNKALRALNLDDTRRFDRVGERLDHFSETLPGEVGIASFSISNPIRDLRNPIISKSKLLQEDTVFLSMPRLTS